MKTLISWWNSLLAAHPFIERLSRNAIAWLAIVGIFYFFLDRTLFKSDLFFLHIAALVAVAVNLGLWVVSKISASDGEENPNVRAALVLGLIVGFSFIAGSIFHDQHKTAKIESLNEEFQSQDSLRVVK